VADQKKTPEKTEPAAPKLARAAESGDPAVQWLLAEQATHGSVGNTEKVAEMERRLNELGYTTK
jgi:HEAT repeat protein